MHADLPVKLRLLNCSLDDDSGHQVHERNRDLETGKMSELLVKHLGGNEVLNYSESFGSKFESIITDFACNLAKL